MIIRSDELPKQVSHIATAPTVSDLQPVMHGLSPAFRDKATGAIHLSRTENGELANVHSFFHLPLNWVCKNSSNGADVTLISTVEAGYWRSTGFIAITKKIVLPLDS